MNLWEYTIVANFLLVGEVTAYKNLTESVQLVG